MSSFMDSRECAEASKVTGHSASSFEADLVPEVENMVPGA